METRDPKRLGTELETTSTTTSPSEENEEPGLCSSQSDPVNLNEPMHYEGSVYGHNPVLYRPVSVFSHPAGYAVGTPQFYTGGGMVNAPTIMPDQAPVNLIQQNRNPISIRHNLPVVYHSHGQIPAAYSLIPNAVQTGNIYHHEHLYGSLPPWNANYRIPSHGMVHHAARPHQIGGSLDSGYTHGWPGMNINPGILHHTNPRVNSLPSNFSVPQHRPQQHFPIPDGMPLSLEHHQHARLNHDSNRFIPDPTAGPRPLSHSHAGLSPSDLARFSRMSLTNTSLARIPNEQHPFELQHGHENVIRVLPIVPPVVLPTVWTGESTNMQNPSVLAGKSSQAQRNQPNRVNQTSVPPFWRNKKQTVSSSRQFSWRKTQTWPSNRQYKLFKENVYHINWDGFETSCQPVGFNCNFCNGDLGYAPGNIESKPPRLPEVSVLSCGHAFHSECFQHEQSADPPCYLCTLGRP